MDKDIIISKASWRDFSQVMRLEKECFPLDVWPMLDILGVLSFPFYVRIKAESEGKLVGFIAGEIKKTNIEGWILQWEYYLNINDWELENNFLQLVKTN